MSLLPGNATHLKQKLEEHNSFDIKLNNAIDIIPAIKTEPPDHLLHWLVWEYGLEEVLPYSSELRQVIKEGLLWQRHRGTPASLRMALQWIGLEDVEIEAEPPGQHFFEYQLDAKKLPGDSNIARMIKLADLSAPERARLSRIYHQYDIRKLELSAGSFGQFLSDYSGVLGNFNNNKSTHTKLSFGRNHYSNVSRDQFFCQVGHSKNYQQQARYLERPVLSHMILGANNHIGLKLQSSTKHSRTSDITISGLNWMGSWDQKSWVTTDYLLIASKHSSI